LPRCIAWLVLLRAAKPSLTASPQTPVTARDNALSPFGEIPPLSSAFAEFSRQLALPLTYFVQLSYPVVTVLPGT
jgi:hypothetical protein